MPEPKIVTAHAPTFLGQLTAAFAEGDPQFGQKQAESDNMKLLEDQYRAIGAGDFEKALSYLAEDVEMEIDCPPAMAFAGKWKGRGPVAEAIGRNFSMVTEMQPQVESVIAQGDTVVVVGREVGKYLPADKWYEVRWVHLHTIRNGQVVKFREIVGEVKFKESTPA